MKKVFLALAGLSLMAGCGGGGDSAPGTNPSFTGVTTQATVTTSNAKALSIDAYTGGQMSSGITVVAKEAAGTGGSRANLPELSRVLENSIRSSVVRPVVSTAKSVAATTQTETVAGFSGSYIVTATVDQVSGAFSGSITYTQYKELSASPVISGSMTFTGVMNMSTGNFITMSATLNSLTIASSTGSFTQTGSMTWGNSGTTTSLTMSVVLKNNTTGKTYWAKDFTYQQTGTAQLMTGTYYDHDHGYVVISTTAQLTAATMDTQPTGGELLFTGRNGTKARLTFIARNGGPIVEVDMAGNGTFVVVL